MSENDGIGTASPALNRQMVTPLVDVKHDSTSGSIPQVVPWANLARRVLGTYGAA
jgi:hypothetical protein